MLVTLLATCVLAYQAPPPGPALLDDPRIAWAQPPTTGPGGAGIRLAGDVPDQAGIPYAPTELRQRLQGAGGGFGCSPVLFGLWGAGEPGDGARDGPIRLRGLTLLRQILRLDVSRLAGPGLAYASPDGWYPPVQGPAFTPGAGPDDPGKDWLGRDIGSPVTVIAHAWPFGGDLVLCDGRSMRIEGRVAVQGTDVSLAFRVRDRQVASHTLARHAAVASLAWPAGLFVGAAPSSGQLGAGWTWATRRSPSARSLSSAADGSWCAGVRSWSDGEWVLLSVRATASLTGGSADMAERARLESSDYWPGALACATPYRPQVWPLLGLGPQTPDLMLGPVPDVIHPAPDLTPTVERCVATFPSEARAAPPPPLTAWKEARVGPAPALVERYLERPDLPESVCLRYDTSGGTRVTGLLRLGGVPGDLHDAHVWWTLGRDCLTVTVLPWNTGRPMWEGLEKRFRSEADSRILTGLFGWRGRAISVVPSTMGPVGDTEWVSLVPDPNHEVGLLERVRVGQTEWGRCRVYKGYGIYHIVFDLLPEDVADR